jgi:hypothetical protein
MTQSTVTRFAATSAVLLITVAGLFAWWASGRAGRRVGDAGVTSPGAQLFEIHCATCHTSDDIRRVIRQASDPVVKVRELEGFLAQHGDASAEADRAILAFLTESNRETDRRR